METLEELLGKESPNQASKKEDPCCMFHDKQELRRLVGLIREGYCIDTDTWVRILPQIQAVWSVSSKGRFRLWKVATFPSITPAR